MPVHPMVDPEHGAVYLDPRGGGRALRVSWHLDRADADGRDASLVVLSLWRDNLCTGSFRLAPAEVPGLIAMLASGLDALERADDGRGHAAAG